MRAVRPLRYFTTRNPQRFSESTPECRRTIVQFLCFVAHDYAREVDGLQGIPRLGVPSPILPVEEDPCAYRLDECDLHRTPVGGTCDLRGLVMWGECSRITLGRSQNRNKLTTGKGLVGDLISPSVFAISHSAQSISAACSRSPSTKSSIFLLTLTRVASVVKSSIHTDASWLTYRLLISSYLRFLLVCSRL